MSMTETFAITDNADIEEYNSKEYVQRVSRDKEEIAMMTILE